VPYSQMIRQHRTAADFSDVRGQKSAKRALEIAAAGGHNVLMIGPPGSGKTMMARCLPGILPDMTLDEALTVTRIHSAAGTLRGGDGLMLERPFRSPHHTVSAVALVGGGSKARPGKSASRTAACSSWTSCRNMTARRWRPCVSRWRTAL